MGDNVYSYVRGNGLVSYNDETNIGLYTTNLHGDVSRIIAYGQKTLAQYGFDAFGNENTAENYVHNPFSYCGEYRDEETGLIYLRTRYYDPDAGRFISEGPAKDGTNWYVYCGNNPVMYVDPWGLYDKALLESLRGYIFGYDNRHTDYHDKANAVRDELKVNAQYLEGWNEGSELDALIAKITSDDVYVNGSSIVDINRAIELTDEYWKNYNKKIWRSYNE